MANRVSTILNESRMDVRVKEKKDILWSQEGGAAQGKGSMRNISASGMLLETDAPHDSSMNGNFNFRAKEGDFGVVPSQGRVIWSKPKNDSKHYWGIKFENVSEDLANALRRRVQDGIEKEKKMRGWLIVLNVAASIFLAWIVVYSVWTSGSIYNSLNKTTQNLTVAIDGQTKLTQTYHQLYTETKQQLEVVTKELATTKAALAETQTMLAQAQQQLAQEKTANTQLQEQVRQMTEQNAKLTEEFNQNLALLNEKNAKLTTEVETLNGKVRYYEGEINNIPEGKELIRLYKDRMRLVKSKIHKFQQDADEIQHKALRERDHARTVLGNNGFLFKGGQAVKVDEGRYKSGDLNQSQTESGKKVNIDVQVVK
ncbi:MAG: PilZ domain-containing protein [Candidatus Omnitrophica bacterium]|nr:PilZ domain-containing protein [Candidatus Omnitrophota bacterium]